jgi:Tfp pilus assembly protein PilF
VTQSKKVDSETVAADTSPRKKNKELPRRKPQAITCVRCGDWQVQESMTADRTPKERHDLLELAKRAYGRALELDPKCVEAHLGMARVQDLEEDREHAISSYRAALQLRPREPAIWFELGMCHGRRQEWQPAIDALSRASEIQPENKQCARILGLYLARAGQFEQSLDYLTRVEGEAMAHCHVGRMMIHLGQLEPGRMQLQLALQQNPNLDEARKVLAELDTGKFSSREPVVPVQYEQQQEH